MNKIIISVFALFLFSQSSVFAFPFDEREVVLHGIEITREDLILTVTSTGCTRNDHFIIDVDTSITPFPVTIYRVKDDRCRAAPHIKKLIFSREELGLEGDKGDKRGLVKFTLQNELGATFR